MKKKNIIPLNKALKIFFRNALWVAIKNPSQSFSFFRTIIWQGKAAKLRSKWKKQGYHIPPIIIFSITNQCDLQCKGCYAQIFHPSSKNELSIDKISGIIQEAAGLGISFFVVAGGEPFMRPEILDITENFPQIIFLLFTNGILINDELIVKFKEQKNVVPLISLEGDEKETDERRGKGIHEKLQVIIRKLKNNNIFFGVSLTLTKPTFDTLTNHQYIQDLVNLGCKFFLFIQYNSVEEGTEALLLTKDQRNEVMNLINSFRAKFPALFIAVPWDEEEVGGCLSAGRGFVHISAEGDIEPCPFAPFSDSNLRKMSLMDALQSPLLKKIRENPEILIENEKGCVLWVNRNWVKSLLQ